MSKNKHLSYQRVCRLISLDDQLDIILALITDLDRTFHELMKPLCLNENEHYKLQLQLKKYGHGDNPRDPVISIDSVYQINKETNSSLKYSFSII